MIKEIYLFTSRNLVAFDEKGEQVIDIQSAISWDRKSYNEYAEEKALLRIITDQPTIWLARWQEWKNPITLDELCSLLGHGKWYWDYKNKEKDNAKGEGGE